MQARGLHAPAAQLRHQGVDARLLGGKYQHLALVDVRLRTNGMATRLVKIASIAVVDVSLRTV